MAVNSYLGEPIINNSTKLSIAVALERMVLTVTSRSKKWPEWFPEEEKERWGNKPDIACAAYVKQKLLELVEYLAIKRFFQNTAIDIYTAGDGFINIATNATPYEESYVWGAATKEETYSRVQELKRKMLQDGRGAYNIFALQGLNPSAVWLYPDYTGRITHAKVVHLLGEGVWDINLNNLIQVNTVGTFTWVIYGIPWIISALKWVDVKFKLLQAVSVNAQRYVSPREWLSIVGPAAEDGAQMPPTEQQMQWADQILSAYSAGIPFVLPTGWDWKYLGAEGKVLKVEQLLEKVDDQIRTAAMVSRTFTSGAANVPAYATSKLQAGIMYKSLKPIQEALASAIEGRILQRQCLFNGWFEDDNKTLISAKVEFQTLPIQGDDSVENKIQILYDRGLLSRHTAWEFEGMDPILEYERMLREQQGVIEPFREVAPDLSPSQIPQRFEDNDPRSRAYPTDPTYSPDGNPLKDTSLKIASLGHAKLIQSLGNFIRADFGGNKNWMEREFWNVNRYMAEAGVLQHADFNHAKNRLDSVEDWEDQVFQETERLKEAKSGNGKHLSEDGGITTVTAKYGSGIE